MAVPFYGLLKHAIDGRRSISKDGRAADELSPPGLAVTFRAAQPALSGELIRKYLVVWPRTFTQKWPNRATAAHVEEERLRETTMQGARSTGPSRK